MRRIGGVTHDAEDECLAEDHVRDERRQGQHPLRKHRAAADGEGVRLDVELLCGGRTAHKAVPSGNCAAGDRDEQNGPDWPEDALRIRQERAHVQLDAYRGTRAQCERGGEGADQDQDDRGIRGVECEVVRRLDEGRSWKYRGQIQDEYADPRPGRDVPCSEREYDRKYRAEVQAEADESQSDCRDREDVHLHAVQQLTTEEPGQENADGWDESGALERIPERGDEGDERGRGDG